MNKFDPRIALINNKGDAIKIAPPLFFYIISKVIS